MSDQRGGARPRTPGKLYPNRSDMNTQPVQVPQGGQYGDRKKLEAAQQAQPIAGAPSASARPSNAPVGLEPGNIPSLSDPSALPDQPLTAGLPTGPGAGPEALNTAAFGPEELSVMRGIYLKYPNEDIRRLIEWTERNLG